MYRTQMKAETIDSADQFRYPCYVSEKLDGWRALIVDGKMYTSGGKEFKPNVQERFKPLITAARNMGLILDGELYYDHNSNFGELSSTLSASLEVMAERDLKFYAFDALTYDEWYGHPEQESFEKRKAQYEVFGKNIKPAVAKLYVAVAQKLVDGEVAADAYYAAIKAKGGEGVMMRTPDGKYQTNTRSKDIVKRKIWHDCSARIVSIHQLACPLKYAEEVREIDGVKHGFKLRAGSVTVEILPDQPLPAGVQQNCMFASGAVALRGQFWAERDTLIGKVVDYEYLPGGTKGRMGRIFRLREDIVPGAVLGV